MVHNVMEEIREEVKRSPIVLYMKGTKTMPRCGFSAATVAVLRQLGVAFRDVDVLANPEKREAIKIFSDWPTIPQLYVGGTFIGGSDIVQEMHANGELEPLVQKALAAV